MNSRTREECALGRNRQPFLHAHIMSTTEKKKYDILLWMSRIESNRISSQSNRVEPNYGFQKVSRIESSRIWSQSNRIRIAIFILFSVSVTDNTLFAKCVMVHFLYY